MLTCDVLIVGGGPSGSSCAWKLRQSGLDVLVLDKATFPRDKVCAGWITPAVVTELQLDLTDYATSRVLQPITGFRTSILGGREVFTQYSEPVSYGIRRCEFDHYLLARSGVRQQLGHPFQSIEKQNGSWLVNHEIQTPLVIGAGGHFCPVARQMAKSSEPEEPAVVAQENEFEMTDDQAAACTISGEVPELFFYPDLRGYAWCFRKGKHLNIGVGREAERNLTAWRDDFCNFLRRDKKVPFDLPGKFHGHAYRLYRQTHRTVQDDGILLIGDAAGLAYPQSGEGIRPAIESGLLAADLIVEARRDYSVQKLNELQSRLTTRLGQRSAPPAAWLPKSLVQFVAARLLATDWFTRRVLLDRWFLHRHQSPLTGAVRDFSSARMVEQNPAGHPDKPDGVAS